VLIWNLSLNKRYIKEQKTLDRPGLNLSQKWPEPLSGTLIGSWYNQFIFTPWLSHLKFAVILFIQIIKDNDISDIPKHRVHQTNESTQK
jgi:hypothetical protein